MTDQEHSENALPGSLDEEAIRRRLAEIDGTLLAGIESDTRLQSSIPAAQQNADLDFIQMSGLTRPAVAPTPEEEEPAPLEIERARMELDPSRPLSFYEPGVMDVDDGFGPANRAQPAIPSMTSKERPRSADALREIIADLSKPPAVENEGVSTAAQPSAGSAPAAASSAELEVDAGAAASNEPRTEETPKTRADADGQLAPAVMENDGPEEPHHPPGDAFDALLRDSSIPERFGAAIDYPEPEKAMAAPIAPDPALTQRLAEAEQLLQELEHQPREENAPPAAPREIRWSQPPATRAASPEENEVDSHNRELRFEYDYSAAPGRRSRRQRAHLRRRFARLLIVLSIAAVFGAAGFAVYNRVLHPAIAPPDEMLSSARQLMEKGEFEAAARIYQHFARRYTDHAALPEAEFDAALALKLAPGGSRDAVRSLREESVGAFKKFAADHPGNPKRARAECLMGMLYFELGDYKNAISLLREPARQVDDPDAVLPILRTLAWAYRMDGNYDDAESAYLQAAALPRNYSVDADYYELGDMYRKRIETAPGPAEKRAFEQKAAEYWDKAVRVPQIDPGTRDTIQKQLDRLRAELEDADAGETGNPSPPPPPAQAAISPPSEVQAPGETDPGGDAPLAEKPKEWEPDPAMEAQPAPPAQ